MCGHSPTEPRFSLTSRGFQSLREQKKRVENYGDDSSSRRREEDDEGEETRAASMARCPRDLPVEEAIWAAAARDHHFKLCVFPGGIKHLDLTSAVTVPRPSGGWLGGRAPRSPCLLIKLINQISPSLASAL